MEYIEGETLESRLTGEPLPLAEIYRHWRSGGRCAGCGAARGHRASRYQARQSDDRRARAREGAGFRPGEDSCRWQDEDSSSSQLATQFLTSGGVVLGTVSYMSPEQALGRDIDHRTDLFSLGVVLYQMASGKLPFAGASAQETLARILQSPPDALGRLNYELPEEFERIVRKCLEKDRERRYQSARRAADRFAKPGARAVPGRGRAHRARFAR